jgi:hypothetical protein
VVLCTAVVDASSQCLRVHMHVYTCISDSYSVYYHIVVVCKFVHYLCAHTKTYTCLTKDCVVPTRAFLTVLLLFCTVLSAHTSCSSVHITVTMWQLLVMHTRRGSSVLLVSGNDFLQLAELPD